MTPQELAELDLAVARVEGKRNPRLEEETPFNEVMCMIDVEEDDIAAAVDFDISRKVIYCDTYQPTRDAQEAMRLLERYGFNLWRKEQWVCDRFGGDPDCAGIGSTPCEAICRCVVALGGRK